MQRATEEKAAAQKRAHDEAVARSAAEQREQVMTHACLACCMSLADLPLGALGVG